MKQSEIRTQMDKTCRYVARADHGQTTGQVREQMYALQLAAIRLGCYDVVRPYYNAAKLADGIPEDLIDV